MICPSLGYTIKDVQRQKDEMQTYKIVLFADGSAAATFLARPDTITLLWTTGLINLKINKIGHLE